MDPEEGSSLPAGENAHVSSSPGNEPLAVSRGAGRSRRDFLRQIAIGAAGAAAAPLLLVGSEKPAEASSPPGPPLPPAPGPPAPWHASMPIYKGVMNQSTGNAHLSHPVVGWGGLGPGIAFALYHNSQSTRSGTLGPKWTHSYNCSVITGEGIVTVIHGDGTEDTYTANYQGYTAPVGVYDQLTHNSDSTWTLVRKGGLTLSFSTAGWLTAIADRNNNVVNLSYSGGVLTSVTDPAGRTLQLGYANGFLVDVSSPDGNTWSITYDSSNRLAAVRDPVLDSTTYSTQFGYDPFNSVNSVANRLGASWSYTHDSTGVLTGMSDPYGYGSSVSPSSPSSSYPSGTTVVSVWTDANGYQWCGGMDQYGRKVAHVTPSGGGVPALQTEMAFDANNNLTSRKLPSGALWQYGFDGLGNQTLAKDPLGNQVQRTFNSFGQVTLSTDANNLQTQIQYDTSGNVLSVTDPTNAVVSNAYGAGGLPQSTTDAMNRVTSFGHDQYGNRTSISDNMGHLTQVAYDIMGRPTQVTSAAGLVTNVQYDAWGRVIGRSYPTTGNPSVSIGYDAEGRVIATSDGTGSRTYAYNAWGSRTSMTSPAGNTSATYDKGQRMLSQTDCSARAISYGWDSASRLISVGDSSGTAGYTYTQDSQPDVVTYPNGTEVAYGYDTAGRNSTIVHRMTSTKALIIGYTMTFDNGSRIQSVTESPSGDVTSLGYDHANRLISESRTGISAYSGSYTYDTSGARTSAYVVTNGVVQQNGTYSYDQAGRLTQVVDTATNTTDVYTWNDDGTLASFPGPGYTREMAYNEQGQMLSITRNQNGTRTLAYEYAYGLDGGRRSRKDYINNVWTRFPCGVACGAGELVEQQSDLTGQSWATTAQYLNGGTIIRRNDEFHHWDYRGTAGVVTDGTGGVLSNNVYDQFQVARYSNGSAQTPWRAQVAQVADEGLLHAGGGTYMTPATAAFSLKKPPPPKQPNPTSCFLCYNWWEGQGADPFKVARECSGVCADPSSPSSNQPFDPFKGPPGKYGFGNPPGFPLGTIGPVTGYLDPTTGTFGGTGGFKCGQYTISIECSVGPSGPNQGGITITRKLPPWLSWF